MFRSKTIYKGKCFVTNKTKTVKKGKKIRFEKVFSKIKKP